MFKLIFITATLFFFCSCHSHKLHDEKGHEVKLTKRSMTLPLYDSSGVYVKDTVVVFEKGKRHWVSFTELHDPPPIQDSIQVWQDGKLIGYMISSQKDRFIPIDSVQQK
ncbi:MAG TPA: hypothetical protein VE978_25905 [Chitinophagales bacterium]|nr:hypothetical protein [Chitinophagales bacterium]